MSAFGFSLKLLKLNKISNCVLSQTHISSTAVLSGKKLTLDNDAQVILSEPGKAEQKVSFGTLLEKAKLARDQRGRQLIHVMPMGSKSANPKFTLVNEDMLKALIQKRSVSATVEYDTYHLVDIDNPNSELKRVKEKIYRISREATQKEIDTTITKARTELSKGNFVVLKLKKAGKTDEERKEFEKQLIENCLEGELADRKHYLWTSFM